MRIELEGGLILVDYPKSPFMVHQDFKDRPFLSRQKEPKVEGTIYVPDEVFYDRLIERIGLTVNCAVFNIEGDYAMRGTFRAHLDSVDPLKFGYVWLAYVTMYVHTFYGELEIVCL